MFLFVIPADAGIEFFFNKRLTPVSFHWGRFFSIVKESENKFLCALCVFVWCINCCFLICGNLRNLRIKMRDDFRGASDLKTKSFKPFLPRHNKDIASFPGPFFLTKVVGLNVFKIG